MSKQPQRTFIYYILLSVLFAASASAFQIRPASLAVRSSSSPTTCGHYSRLFASTAAEEDSLRDSSGDSSNDSEIVDRSTLTLLEHINFNIPSHDLAVPFYYDILGCGVDPRMAGNLQQAEQQQQQPDFDSTIWANCGASQFHLCYNDQSPATVPGRIGLRYDNLDGLEQRLNDHVFEVLADRTKQCFQSFIQERDSQGNPQITVVDRYNNVFVCRTVPQAPHPTSPVAMAQPILSNNTSEMTTTTTGTSTTTSSSDYEELAKRYGRSETECRGIDYVEIPVLPGQASKIAEFYESVFDATVRVVPQPPDANRNDTDLHIAMIALGNVMDTGRADQYLLFKEENNKDTADPTTILRAGHHHMAIYVGASAADFEQAYRNAEQAGVVWINPRYDDRVDSLAAAQREHQFRFKTIVDLETGEPLLELEHEIRSRDHPSWPGHPTTTTA